MSIAVGYLAAIPLLFAPFLLIQAVMLLVESNWRGLLMLLPTSAALALLGTVSFALARRRPWSRPAAIVACAVLTLGFVVLTASPFLWPSDEGDGAMYVIMGGVQLSVLSGVVLWQLVTRVRPDSFRPLTAGWLPDPMYQAHLRYWDGLQWTTHVAP